MLSQVGRRCQSTQTILTGFTKKTMKFIVQQNYATKICYIKNESSKNVLPKMLKIFFATLSCAEIQITIPDAYNKSAEPEKDSCVYDVQI